MTPMILSVLAFSLSHFANAAPGVGTVRVAADTLQHGGRLACIQELSGDFRAHENLRDVRVFAYVGLDENAAAELLENGELERPSSSLVLHRGENASERFELASREAWHRTLAGLIQRRAQARGLNKNLYNELVYRLFDELFDKVPETREYVSPTIEQLQTAMLNTPLGHEAIRSSNKAQNNKFSFFGYLLGLNLTEPRDRDVLVELFSRLPSQAGLVLGVSKSALSIDDPEMQQSPRRRLRLEDVIALQARSEIEARHLRRIFRVRP